MYIHVHVHIIISGGWLCYTLLMMVGSTNSVQGYTFGLMAQVCVINYHVLSLQRRLPPLHYAYLIPFVPSGFWPRLMSRLLSDKSIMQLAKEGCCLAEEGTVCVCVCVCVCTCACVCVCVCVHVVDLHMESHILSLF